MPPELSIIIPAYNEEKYIKATLHSIKNQTFQNFEVIIVTNGCTDKTEEMIQKRTNERIRHLSLPKANVSVARNAGALNATGTTLVFVDADTQLAPNTLQQIHHQFIPEYSVASTHSKPDINELKYRITFALKNIYQNSWLYQGCSGVLVCRKEDFHSVGGYNPDLMVKEHRKLILKLKERGKFRFIDTTVTTSTRRFQHWGLSKAFFFWVGQWVKDKVGDLRESKYELVR